MATWIKTAMEFQRGEVTLLYPEGLAGGLLRGCWPLKAGEGGLLALPFP